MSPSRFARTLSCLFATSFYLHAEPPANVTGTVTDSSGAVVTGAAVVLRCSGQERSSRTSSEGQYTIPGATGDCRLQVTASGFDPATRDVTVPEGDAPVQVNVSLVVASAATSIRVIESEGYVAVSQSTGAKSELSLIETPQAVSVITNEQLIERGVQSINEAMRYTSGVAVDTWGADARLDWFMIRGFTEDEYGSYRDGLRWPSGLGRADPYGVEEIEVLKGPSSVLYGQNAPGGLVNMTSKRPPSMNKGEIAVQFGNFSRKQVMGDVGGPIGDGSRMAYRLTGLYRDRDTQVDFTPSDRVFIAPAFTWRPASRTSITFLADYQRDRTRWSQFLPSQGTLTYNPNGVIPVNFFDSEPDFDFVHQYQYAAGYQLTHRFSEAWTVRQNLRYSCANYDGATAYGLGLEPDLRTLDRAAYTWKSGTGVTTIDNQAEARFRTGFLSHTFLSGFDYARFGTDTGGQFAAAPAIDVFRPVYGQPIGALTTYTDTSQVASQYGVYVQDQIKFGGRWVALLSGRHDWNRNNTHDLLASSDAAQNDRKFTGRAGLVYNSSIGLAPYFSYSTSFLPTIGVDYYGQPFKPSTGQQQEAGLRFKPGNWNGLISASVFNLQQSNVQTPDPANSLNTIQTGKVRVRGVEVEGLTSLFAGINLHLSYTYNNARITETTVLESLGKHPTQIPDQYASALVEYTIPKGPLAGLGVGAGTRYVGIAAASTDNLLNVPGYTLYDASMHYTWKHMRFDVNATNLTDRRYVAVCSGLSYCNFGYSRAVIGTARYQW